MGFLYFKWSYRYLMKVIPNSNEIVQNRTPQKGNINTNANVETGNKKRERFLSNWIGLNV